MAKKLRRESAEANAKRSGYEEIINVDEEMMVGRLLGR